MVLSESGSAQDRATSQRSPKRRRADAAPLRSSGTSCSAPSTTRPATARKAPAQTPQSGTLRGPPRCSTSATRRRRRSSVGRVAPGDPETCEACFTHRNPHVARLSGGVATDHPRERVRNRLEVLLSAGVRTAASAILVGLFISEKERLGGPVPISWKGAAYPLAGKSRFHDLGLCHA